MACPELVAMRNRKTVSLYVEEADKSRIEREAEQAGLSQSEYIKSILRQHWNQQDTDEAADKMDAEEKIERVANQALREIEDATRHTEQRVDALADMVARSGSYSIANFELLKHQHAPPEGTTTDALQVGVDTRTGQGSLSIPPLVHPALPPLSGIYKLTECEPSVPYSLGIGRPKSRYVSVGSGRST